MIRLRISHYRIRRTKSLLDARRPFRLAVLADLHNSALADAEGLLRRQIKRLEPDAILCCGDLLTAKFGKVGSDRALSLLNDLTGRYPVYAVNGNHETRLLQRREKYPPEAASWFTDLEKMGVHMLNNRSEQICLGGGKVLLCGYEADLDCYRRIRPELPGAGQIRSRLGEAPGELYTIMLLHHPDCFEAAAGWGADLVLAGHLHGGMVRLPLLGGVIGAGVRPFPRYDRGKFEAENGRRMIVSAGLGDHTIPLRVNNPPELVVLE